MKKQYLVIKATYHHLDTKEHASGWGTKLRLWFNNLTAEDGSIISESGYMNKSTVIDERRFHSGIEYEITLLKDIIRLENGNVQLTWPIKIVAMPSGAIMLDRVPGQIKKRVIKRTSTRPERFTTVVNKKNIPQWALDIRINSKKHLKKCIGKNFK